MATASRTNDGDEANAPETDDLNDQGAGENAQNADPAPERPSRRRPRRPPPPPPRKGSLGTSMVLFVIVVGGLAAGFAILGKEPAGGGSSAPKWQTGKDVDVEITLVANDKSELACGSATELEGKKCGFEDQNKPWKTGAPTEDKKLFKPYTTTDNVQFLAAGLWSDPALSGTLPAARFAVKCKYKVEGKLAKPAVRWNSEGPWYPQTNEWYAGAVHDCKLVQ
jgi:hypothetical protein